MNDWTEVESGAELLQLKAQLGDAGWNYFYLGAVKETAIGKSSKSFSLAVAAIAAQMRLNECNSLQIDTISAHSWLGIPYTKVSAHCCHIQESMIFARRRR